jgi:hypothetical protein
MYQILPYTFRQAKRYNLIVKPSTRKNKKIDVYNKAGKYLGSAGHIDYLDYPYFKKYFGDEIAKEKRKQYKRRHEKDRTKKNTPGWFADKLLW